MNSKHDAIREEYEKIGRDEDYQDIPQRQDYGVCGACECKIDADGVCGCNPPDA